MKKSTMEVLHKIGEGVKRGAEIGMHLVTPIAAAGGLVAGGMVGMVFGEPTVANVFIPPYLGFCSGVAVGLTVGSVGGALIGGLKAGCDELKLRKKSKVMIGSHVINIGK
jgi:hypothetical protein